MNEEKMKYKYKIANRIISIEDDFSVPIFYKNAEEFQTDDTSADMDFYFFQESNLGKYLVNAQFICETPNFHIYHKNGQEYRAFFEKGYYFGVTWLKENKGYFAYINEKIIERKSSDGYSPFMYLCLEKIYLDFRTLFLHSSFIKYEEYGIAFSAPSGTGKSTHAKLWEEYEDAKIINGDRAALNKINNQWMIHGIPMCGTSGIHHNYCTVLKSIIIIRQAPYNKVSTLSIAEKFRLLFSEISVNNWDVQQTNITMDLIQDLITHVPIYLLECTKEPEAVEVLKNYLF